MQPARLEHLDVGSGSETRRIAILKRDGAAPGLFWLSGFRSDMEGTKAAALDRWAAENGLASTRFDYSGHGRSGGAFLDGTISRWLEEAEAAFATTATPQLVVGSSMGGWIALLMAQRLAARKETARLAGLVLIAPAVDMTEALMAARWSKAQGRAFQKDGRLVVPNAYAEEPTIITRALVEDGRKHLLGNGPIEIGSPVHVIQGMQDPDVPWPHATALMEKLAFDDAVLTLVRDGDHRLSRPEDIERMIHALAEMIAG